MKLPFPIPLQAEFDAVGFGLNAVDHLIVVPHYPDFDTKIRFHEYQKSAGGLLVFVKADLCIEVRVMRHDDQVVDRVQAKTNSVKLGLQRNRKRKLHSTDR